MDRVVFVDVDGRLSAGHTSSTGSPSLTTQDLAHAVPLLDDLAASDD